MSLRLKFALIIIFACALGDAVVITLWQPGYMSQAIQRERHALHSHLATLGDAITPLLLQNQIGSIYELFDETLKRQREWQSLILRDSNGEVIYPLTAHLESTPSKYIEHVSHNITLRNTSIGQVELTADTSNLISTLQQKAWSVVGIFTLGFILVGLLIGATLEYVVSRKTRLLVKAAERISRGDFSTTVPKGGNDEISRLADTFETMRNAIAANERSLIDARIAAEASNKAKSQFLATMSHEIRTPLNGVLGMAQLLLMPNLRDDKREEYTRTILNSGQTLLIVLNDILDFSKIEAGKLTLTRSVFNPEQLVKETSLLFSQLAQAKKLTINVSWRGPKDQRYIADSTRLRQMLSNLVGNAIKFTKRGTIHVEASEIEHGDNHALLEFSVTDNGIGIPADKQALLFNPFTQADSSTTREYGGTGLGLSIIRSLAKLMEGSVGLESEMGKGSRFWFRVRVALPHGTEDGSANDPNTQINRNTRLRKQLVGHVLVVEDNRINRVVAEAILSELGLTTESVENGELAVDAIKQGMRPDIILMDMQMPVMDGITATKLIRQWQQETNQPHIPIVALTAGAYEEDQTLCLTAGMDDFLTKPVHADKLAEALSKWVKQPE